LAKHKSAWDCWICIYGRCFDFTKFQVSREPNYSIVQLLAIGDVAN
jgi:hypothetical protein